MGMTFSVTALRLLLFFSLTSSMTPVNRSNLMLKKFKLMVGGLLRGSRRVRAGCVRVRAAPTRLTVWRTGTGGREGDAVGAARALSMSREGERESGGCFCSPGSHLVTAK